MEIYEGVPNFGQANWACRYVVQIFAGDKSQKSARLILKFVLRDTEES